MQCSSCDSITSTRFTKPHARPAKVAPHEHRAWLEAVLADSERLLPIAERDACPIGQVRFGGVAGEWEISIALTSAARGSSDAAAAIGAGVAWLLGREGPVALVAYVRESNAASRRAFARADFPVVRHCPLDGFILMRADHAATVGLMGRDRRGCRVAATLEFRERQSGVPSGYNGASVWIAPIRRGH